MNKLKLVLIVVLIIILINLGVIAYFYFAPPESSPIPAMFEFCHADEKELTRKNLNNQLVFSCAIVKNETIIFEHPINCELQGEDWVCNYV